MSSPTSKSVVFKHGIRFGAAHLILEGLLYVVAVICFFQHESSAGELELHATFWTLVSAMAGGSAILLLCRTTATVIVTLSARLFVFILLGYALEPAGYVRLILATILMLESTMLPGRPWNYVASGAYMLLLVLAQFSTGFLGVNLLLSTADRRLVGENLEFLSILAAISTLGLLLHANMQDKMRERHKSRSLEMSLSQLSQFNLKLQQYARVADEETTERERLRITRELHDVSGYIFTNLIALMDAAISGGGKDLGSLIETLVIARRQAREGLIETRNTLHRLRDAAGTQRRGVREIQQLVEVFRKVTGISTELTFGNLPDSLGNGTDEVLYRVVQEAMTNAIKHSHATRFSVRFWIHHDCLTLDIRDNGVGARHTGQGIGLAGMNERVQSVGGSIRAGNAPEGGFFITVEVPVSVWSPVVPDGGPGDAAKGIISQQ